MKKKFLWEFPKKKFLILKIEIFFIVLLAILVFTLSFLRFNKRSFIAELFTIIFLWTYVLISFIIQKSRSVQEKYHISNKSLEITRREKNLEKKEKALLKDISYYKVDKFFLGGYVITKEGAKHLLFFNTKKEIETFEKFLKRKK